MGPPDGGECAVPVPLMGIQAGAGGSVAGLVIPAQDRSGLGDELGCVDANAHKARPVTASISRMRAGFTFNHTRWLGGRQGWTAPATLGGPGPPPRLAACLAPAGPSPPPSPVTGPGTPEPRTSSA